MQTSSKVDYQFLANDLQSCDTSDLKSVATVAVRLARQLQTRAKQLQTPAERRQQAELDRMVQHPRDKAILTQMTDQAFRSQRAARAADQLVHILDVQGIPRFFSPVDRTMLRGFQSFGGYLPGVSVPLVKEKMRQETANVILPAEPEMLRVHLQARRAEGVRMNLNLLGEAMLGEEEAQLRLESYLSALQMPEVEVVSVKISTLYSQISTLARAESMRTVANRLELLYRAAQRNRFQRQDGTHVTKFVYLDMEEYRDLQLTSSIFMMTLDRPGFEQVRAGIALQAYVPDSFQVQQEITEWAKRRVATGAAPVTIRLVKGANMEMEKVEASQRGWPQAPYHEKRDTDANFKRMVAYGLQPENLAAVKLGIASHNLFEVAFSIVLASKYGVLDELQFEMLEGMANHQRRALHELIDNLLLYAPACRKDDFIYAIGYLVRRMDENTGPDNFLRHAFKIEVDSPDWRKMEQIFLDSMERLESAASSPRRTQDRNLPPQQPAPSSSWQQFVNEPDTDFGLRQNAAWAKSVVDSWQPRCDLQATEIPLTIAGRDVPGEGSEAQTMDPSRPGVVVARYRQASPEQIAQSIACAQRDSHGWGAMDVASRYALLRKVAQEVRVRRADLAGAAMADSGKTLQESDPEISEAIDFVEFYAQTAQALFAKPRWGARPVGPVVVISPWNFPIAIPCGGIAAALAAGNTVILKPASDTVLSARVLCECFWAAGVPRDVLQFVACSGSHAGKYLLSDPAIQYAILTGGTETAQRILAARPDLHLLAETGGKNATIVSSLSDRDLVIKNVLHSAFSHAGQKCSATSLLLLEAEVYHDKRFREALVDAVESMPVGSAWNLKTKMGPLIRPPIDDLARGLKELEPGESWAVMPRDLDDNPCLYSPGVKWGVQPGGFTHCNELFGPVLGVMSYRDLNEAINLVHQTGYGLTSGLESLDDREQEVWLSRLQAGNLYINRPTTGAIVLRQPFGGMGKSAFGPGIKAGGPNYVIPLMHFAKLEESDAECLTPSAPEQTPLAELAPELEPLSAMWQQLQTLRSPTAKKLRQQLKDSQWQQLHDAILDYDSFAVSEIRRSHDTLRLVGQDNLRRYQPMTHVRIRVMPEDSVLEIYLRAVAVVAAGGRAAISHAAGVQSQVVEGLEVLTRVWAGDMEFIEESDEALIEAIAQGQVDRVRYAGSERVPPAVRQAADKYFIFVAAEPVCPFGRIELLWYVREQSVCHDYHRYGNLGFRSEEVRSPVA
ncbi:bifunctional proline dehydrogenase/L-glutamate gamma-semialdehyde dehydrogenase [Aureliella helgolandensis]|uniref:L-glutamate gamma-semialdehyde dehydrogenase n=1 Tax=Aureliella helgolandensis TaxID=2527968 RepID=A0A518GHH5_9BACT|nr:bifunctional proline dehydrogenase/L-glutamate gamma-semialdehyde dehydrogenase [Aureliella helgolandensis]QDV28049.1 Bifunctional protein PutA [Aureliella helgolandensis]